MLTLSRKRIAILTLILVVIFAAFALLWFCTGKTTTKEVQIEKLYTENALIGKRYFILTSEGELRATKKCWKSLPTYPNGVPLILSGTVCHLDLRRGTVFSISYTFNASLTKKFRSDGKYFIKTWWRKDDLETTRKAWHQVTVDSKENPVGMYEVRVEDGIIVDITQTSDKGYVKTFLDYTAKRKKEREWEAALREKAVIDSLLVYDVSAIAKKPGFNEGYNIRYSIRNDSERSLSKIYAAIYFLDSNGDAIFEIHDVAYDSYLSEVPLRPGYVADASKSIPTHSIPSVWETGKVSIKVYDVDFKK